MIIDYRNGYEEAITRGIISLQTNPLYDTPHICLNETLDKIENVAFRNFPQLEGEELSLINCSFEDCGKLIFNDCDINHCIFYSVDEMEFDDSVVEQCRFERLYSDCGEIITLIDSTMSHCYFEDVKLEEDQEWGDASYLCTGIGDAWMEHCYFENIRTNNSSGEIFHYENRKKKFFGVKKPYCFVDEDTCTRRQEL